jgi:energy-coupling factor transporter ATP-binding protein EcfA2
LTVEQSLRYAARLRMQNRSETEIEERIKKVLDDLNIAKIRHSKVGDISGGQRKRVSIAVEILNEPMILFLDEPTSPLDPQTIEDFLERLQNLSKQGMTVVLVTHKPEDLNYVNDVMFLAEGGHITFFGKVNQYLTYFDVEDTVKVYSSLTEDKSQKWIEKFKQQNAYKSREEKLTTKQLKQSQKTNYFSQYWWLTMRYFSIKLNDKKNTWLMLGQAILIPGLIYLIYDHLELSILFLMSVSAIWFGTNNAAREIVGELPIYSRERMYNLGIFPYIFSKITVLGTFAAIQSLIFVFLITISFSSSKDANLPTWLSFPKAYLWMFTISVVSILYGLLLSSITENTEKVMTIVPIALLPQIMLAGVLARITNPLVEFLSYMTISRWGTEGFSVIQKDVSNRIAQIGADGKLVETFEKESATKLLRSNFHENMFVDLFGKYSDSIRPDLIALLVLSLLFLTVIALALRSKDSIKN